MRIKSKLVSEGREVKEVKEVFHYLAFNSDAFIKALYSRSFSLSFSFSDCEG